MAEKVKGKVTRKSQDKKRDVGIRVLMRSDLAEKLRARAEAENRTLSTMIMMLVERGLRNGD